MQGKGIVKQTSFEETNIIYDKFENIPSFLAADQCRKESVMVQWILARDMCFIPDEHTSFSNKK